MAKAGRDGTSDDYKEGKDFTWVRGPGGTKVRKFKSASNTKKTSSPKKKTQSKKTSVNGDTPKKATPPTRGGAGPANKSTTRKGPKTRGGAGPANKSTTKKATPPTRGGAGPANKSTTRKGPKTRANNTMGDKRKPRSDGLKHATSGGSAAARFIAFSKKLYSSNFGGR